MCEKDNCVSGTPLSPRTPGVLADELDVYRENVARLADLNSTEVFSNGKAEHAAIIFETFFQRANRRVIFFCQNLSRDVFARPGLRIQMQEALRKNIAVDFLIQSPPESEDLEGAIQNWQADGLPVNLIVAKNPTVQNLSSNFAVMDGKAYRFEENRGEKKAVACMNGVASAKGLVSLFGILKGYEEAATA